MQTRKAIFLESQRIKPLLTLNLFQFRNGQDWEHEDEADIQSPAGETDGYEKGINARVLYHDKVLREEKSRLRSGKASRMFIMSLSLKMSRVSQSLREKAQTPYFIIH